MVAQLVLIQERKQEFIFSSERRDWLWGSPIFLANAERGVLSVGLELRGNETDRSNLFSAGVGMLGAMPPVPHTAL
jgi:hypothetical protein